MTMTTPQTKPDVDLTDGAFYAGDSRSAYKWMRQHEPVFRDRNGLAGGGELRRGHRGRTPSPSCSPTRAASGPISPASR